MSPGSPDQLFEERISRDVAEMDELCCLTMDPEQRPLVQQQAVGIAQILLRAQLILTHLEGRDVEMIKRLIRALDDNHLPGKLKMVSNG